MIPLAMPCFPDDKPFDISHLPWDVQRAIGYGFSHELNTFTVQHNRPYRQGEEIDLNELGYYQYLIRKR